MYTVDYCVGKRVIEVRVLEVGLSNGLGRLDSYRILESIRLDRLYVR